MKNYILIAAQGKKLETDHKNKQSGIYEFNWEPKEKVIICGEDKLPELKIPDETGVNITPRLIFTADDYIHVLTRNNLCSTDSKNWPNHTKRKLSEILGENKNGIDINNFIDQDMTSASFLNYDNTEMFIGLYGKNPRTKKNEGNLYYNKEGNLDELICLNDQCPTGPIIQAGNRVLISSNNEVNTLFKRNNSWKKGAPLTLSGGVLALSHEEGYTIATDTKGGYLIEYNGQQATQFRTPNYNYFGENKNRLILPSEAMSVAIQKSDGGNYAFFGLDDGKLAIYQLNQIKGAPQINHIKTISLLSTMELLNFEKDNYVRNMRIQEGLLCFTLRNLFIRSTIDNLINLPENKNITPNDEMYSERELLKNKRVQIDELIESNFNYDQGVYSETDLEWILLKKNFEHGKRFEDGYQNSTPEDTTQQVPSLKTKTFKPLSNILKLGSKNNQVRELQQLLAELDYFNHEPTGYYGKITKEAVMNFQNDIYYMIDGVDGVVDIATWAALNTKIIQINISEYKRAKLMSSLMKLTKTDHPPEINNLKEWFKFYKAMHHTLIDNNENNQFLIEYQSEILADIWISASETIEELKVYYIKKSRENEQQYATNLKDCYNLDIVLQVPHRITSWEVMTR
ncbi:hypothetical protein COV12_00515 [Candidatus Woesearchaeota archaeon CG10_big_fil_rev_8_21_14_0_10_32_24]|nr:MAG: hypothetical protein COV12_00515 [Candidatus Woesearchaeota archaeon CG10_big_fil_rev_8_21_14_0_10_32_24]